MTDLTPQELIEKLRIAFSELYPSEMIAPGNITLGDDETILVEIPEGPTFRAMIDSDDDGFLRFHVYDEDFAEEFPDHPETVTVLVKVL